MTHNPKRGTTLVVGGLAIGLTIWAIEGVVLALQPRRSGGLAGSQFRHLVVAAVFAFGLGMIWPPLVRWRAALLVLFASVVIGIALELAQARGQNGRHMDPLDVLQNLIGVGVGLTFACLVLRFRRPTGLAVTFVVLGASLVLATSEVVDSAPAFAQRMSCQVDRASRAAVTRTLSDRADGVALHRNGSPLPTTFGPGRSSDTSADDLIKEIKCRNSFRASVTVVPNNVEQSGPRRIVALSIGTAIDEQNFVLGIEAQDLVLRMRVRATEFESFIVPGVFKANERHRLVVSFRAGRINVSVNGSIRWSARSRTATLLYWSPEFALHVGNEATDDRRFEGAITDLRIAP